MKPTRHAHGFTLVEVIVALVILAVALAAAARATAVATDSAGEARVRMLATWVAQNRVAELTAAGAFPAAGSEAGTASMGGIDFDWTVTARDTPNPAFRRIEVGVRRAGGREPAATLNAYLVRAP